MARKNSPALFEVIRNAQQKQKEQADRQRQQQLAAEVHAHSPAAGLLMSPIYWFKGKLAHEAAIDRPAADPAADTALPVMREVPKPRKAIKRTPPPQSPAVEHAATPANDDAPAARAETGPVETPAVTALPATPVVPVIEKTAVETPIAETPVEAIRPPAPVYTPAPTSAAAEAMRQMREELAAQEAPAADPMFDAPAYDRVAVADKSFGRSAFDVDDEPLASRGFQFTYTSAAVAGFAIVVAFAVAYVIGSHNRSSQLAANAPDPNAARGNVLNVGPAEKPTDKPAKADPVSEPTPPSLGSVNAAGDVALAGIGKPIAVPTDVKRVVGMHYVVLQSFPSEYDAKELVKYLAANGVAATAERPLPGYAPRWTSVITVRGFDHVKNNPALDAYNAALTNVLKKYAAEQGGLKKNFKLDLYKWKTAAK